MAFLTRLPLWAARDDADWTPGRFLRWAPLAGVAVSSSAAIVLVVASFLGLPVLVVATLAVAAGILASGALHEDGLADVADGFGGGASVERKLAIMRDSRIGSYAALALGCSLLVRVGCVSTLLLHGPTRACAALVVAGTVSRAAMLIPLALLPQARTDGLAHAAGSLPRRSLVVAAALAAALGLAATLVTHGSLGAVAIACLGAALAGLAIAALARRQIGGVTGDVIGATQQIAEVAVLIVLSATLPTL